MTFPTHLPIGIDMLNAEGTPWDGLAFHLKGDGERKEEENTSSHIMRKRTVITFCSIKGNLAQHSF